MAGSQNCNGPTLIDAELLGCPQYLAALGNGQFCPQGREICALQNWPVLLNVCKKGGGTETTEDKKEGQMHSC